MKTKLKTKRKTYIEVNYSELESVIEELYNNRYDIVSGEEWGNDSSEKKSEE